MQTWNTPRYTGHRHTVGLGGVVFTPPSANLACGDVALGQTASPHPHLTISKVALLQEDIQAETIGPGLSELFVLEVFSFMCVQSRAPLTMLLPVNVSALRVDCKGCST
jgi:hypothetical protein